MSTLAKSFVSVAGLLLALGLLMVYSASITSRPTEFEEVYLSRQLLFVGVALCASVSAVLTPTSFWRRSTWMLMGVVVVLLALVLIPGLGVSVKGARRWLRLGGYSLQPSELAKVVLPLVICRISADGAWRRQAWWRSLLTMILPVSATVGLVVIEPDLGTALFLVVMTGGALYFSGWPLRRFVWLGLAVVPMLAGAVALRPYQLARVRGFLAAWQDFHLAPYQLRQSLTTLGSGGLFGAGLGQGQQKLSFLPEANTDFVFAVIGEELGLLGTVGVILLWGALFGLGVRLLSQRLRGSFEHAAGMTLLCGLVLQAALNMAVVLALVPPKGISLPLISYGGSSLVTSLLTIGIILSLSRGDSVVSDRSASALGPSADFLAGSEAEVRD
ncbi:MAG: FtsW/RodA/SpoVE family cell cycle protein [Planctomycetaceae bacterium]